MEHPNKAILLQHQEELQQRVQRIEKDLASPHSADSAEQAVERENDYVFRSLKLEAEEELGLIDSALRRLEAGEYGYCTHCGEEIQSSRLEVMPWALRCINCADLT